MNLTPSHYDYVLGSTSAFIECVIGHELEDYMIEVCDLIDKHDKVIVYACHGVGKSHGLGAIIVALMSARRGIKIISTAPTFPQVKDILWKEIRTSFNQMMPLFKFGKLNEVDWHIDSKTFAKGLAVQNQVSNGSGQGTESTLQGYHAEDKVVAVIDEGVGVRPSVWTMIEGIISTKGDKLISIGNPTTKNCTFYREAHSRGVKSFQITCFMTPNFKANGILNISHLREQYKILTETKNEDEWSEFLDSFIVVKPYLIHVAWALDRMYAWGEDHPSFQAKVLGEFPADDESSLIPEHVVVKAQGRSYEIQVEDDFLVGVDIARFGSDSTVFTSIIGWQQVGLQVHNKLDSIEVLRRLIPFLKDSSYYGDRKIRIGLDSGYGQGVIDTLVHWLIGTLHEDSIEPATDWDRENIVILEINFGSTDWVRWHYGWKDEKALREENLQEDRKVQEDRENYLNFKAKMFDILARDLRNKLALLPEKVYVESLPTIILVPASDSKMKIESKEDYKKRTGLGSPDEGDSLALANLARTFAAKPLSVLEAFESY